MPKPSLYFRRVSIKGRARRMYLFVSSLSSELRFSFRFVFFIRFPSILFVSLSFLFCILLSTVPGIVFVFVCFLSLLSASVFTLPAYLCCACRTQYDGMALRSLMCLRVLNQDGHWYACVFFTLNRFSTHYQHPAHPVIGSCWISRNCVIVSA